MKNETVAMPPGLFFWLLNKTENPKKLPKKSHTRKQYLAPKVTLQVPAVKKGKKWTSITTL